jgi:hypothetical protein
MEVRPVEVRPAEVRPAEVRPAEVRPAEVHPTEVRRAEVPRDEDRPLEVRPLEVPPAEVHPSEVHCAFGVLRPPVVPGSSLPFSSEILVVCHIGVRPRAGTIARLRGQRPLRPEAAACDAVAFRRIHR